VVDSVAFAKPRRGIVLEAIVDCWRSGAVTLKRLALMSLLLQEAARDRDVPIVFNIKDDRDGVSIFKFQA